MGRLIRCVDASLAVIGGIPAGREQRHRRHVLDHSPVCGGVHTAVEHRQPQGQEFLTLMAPSPARTYTTDSAVSIGLVALEQPRGLISSVDIVAPELAYSSLAQIPAGTSRR